MSKYYKADDVIRKRAEDLADTSYWEWGNPKNVDDWIEVAEMEFADLPTIEVMEYPQVEGITPTLVTPAVSEDMVSRKDFEDVIRRMGERNCFTCGVYHEGEWTLMARNPEKVTAEELEENDRAVSLAEVCKIIQDTYEVCPATWGRLRNLPSVTTEQSSKVGEWIEVNERLPENDGDYLVWARFDHEDDYAPSVINYDACAEAFGVWDNYFDPDTLGFVGSDFIEIDVIAWQPLPKRYVNEDKGESE